MRLDILDNGHSRVQKLQMKIIRTMMAGHLPGPIAIQSYRPDFFGKEYNDIVMLSLRGTTEWTKAEAELFAAFVSHNNSCNYCYGAHSAIAVKGFDEETVTAVLDDWKTAPVNEKIRTTLGFLAKLTRTPDKVTPADLEPMFAAGVNKKGIEEAIRVCFAFSTINRLADAFDFELANQQSLKRMGFMLYNMGYGLAIVPGFS